MIKFIYACMAVVALSFLSIGGQYVYDGIKDAQQEIAARNLESPLNDDVAAREASQPAVAQIDNDAAALNSIETAAGATDQPDAGFGKPFTDTAPAALADKTQATVPSDKTAE